MATGTPTTYEYVDPKIVHPLSKLRGYIRSYVTLDSFITTILFFAFWFWAAVVIDYGVFRIFTFDWVEDAPRTLRTIALIVAVALVIALVATRLVLRLTRELTLSSMALVLEKRFPKQLGDRLITAVELSDLKRAESYGYSVDMVKNTINGVRETVDTLPIKSVFNWKRIYTRVGLFVFLSFGLFILVGGVAFGMNMATKKNAETGGRVYGATPGDFVRDFSDVGILLAKRDVLLQNAPWPRRAHVEIVSQPAAEIRFGRDRQQEKVRIQAFERVIADPDIAHGWRPLRWSDVKAITKSDPPELPLAVFMTGTESVVAQTKTAIEFDNDSPDWPVDRVFHAFVGDTAQQSNAKFDPAVIESIKTTIAKVDEFANDDSNRRYVRKLALPSNINLTYETVRGSDGTVPLSSEGYGVYAGMITDLKESLSFRVKAEDFWTPRKKITIVPPPMISEFYRDENQPAYLYYKPAYQNSPPYMVDLSSIKGRKVMRAKLGISLTGPISRFEIPQGTDLELVGKTDKPLKEALIIPKPGKYPGANEGEEPKPIKMTIDKDEKGETRVFRYSFAEQFGTRVATPIEFEIFMRDTDNVTNTRKVQIVPDEDKPPEVDIQIDVIRRVGSTYLCTNRALIPFTKESRASDKRGLSGLRYTYSYYELDSASVVNKRAESAARVLAGTPILPGLGDAITKASAVYASAPGVGGGKATVKGQINVSGFVDAYKTRQAPSKAELDEAIQSGTLPAFLEAMTPIYTFSGYDPERADRDYGKMGLDLAKEIPGLFDKNEDAIQKSFFFTLDIEALDTNVDNGPTVGRNKEQFVFKIVSEAELLGEIAREETSLGEKLDDVLKRLREMDVKLRQTLTRLPGLVGAESFAVDQARSVEYVETILKCRDLTAEVNTDYTRILREYQANAVSRKLTSDLDSKVIRPLGKVLENDFPDFEKTYGLLHDSILAAKNPTPQISEPVPVKLTSLIGKIQAIRNSIGQGVDQAKLAQQLETIIRNQEEIDKYIRDLVVVLGNREKSIIVEVPGAAITVQAGQTTTVKLRYAIGSVYLGNYKIKVTKEGDVTVPAELVFEEGKNTFDLQIKGGDIKGDYVITLTPDIGPVRFIKVIVK